MMMGTLEGPIHFNFLIEKLWTLSVTDLSIISGIVVLSTPCYYSSIHRTNF